MYLTYRHAPGVPLQVQFVIPENHSSTATLVTHICAQCYKAFYRRKSRCRNFPPNFRSPLPRLKLVRYHEKVIETTTTLKNIALMA